MAVQPKFSEYFGFTEKEVDMLYDRYLKRTASPAAETPLLDYNDEIELTAIVNLVYLAARDSYYVERENKAGKGYADFIFYPERTGDDGIILELKVDDTPEAAIAQIKDRKYMLKFQGKMAERKRNTGRILLVGIGYDRKDKVHHCRIEVMQTA